MKVFVKDIATYMEKIAPISLACEWDNVGLIIGDCSRVVKKIVVCLDLTREVLDFAIENKASLILSHHPFIFKGVKKINMRESYGAIIEDIIKNDISVYSAHTNFDFTHNGLNDILAKTIDLHYSNSLYMGKCRDKILGKIGELVEECRFEDLVNKVRDKLNVDGVRAVGDLDRIVKKVVVFSGAFDDSMLELLKSRVDVIVTGDIKHHVALDIIRNGLCAVDAGHFGTEYIFVDYVKKMLEQNFEDIDVLKLASERDLFIYM